MAPSSLFAPLLGHKSGSELLPLHAVPDVLQEGGASSSDLRSTADAIDSASSLEQHQQASSCSARPVSSDVPADETRLRSDEVRSQVRRPRVALFDNARSVLIYLVVLYHSAVVYTSADRPDSPIAVWSGVLVILKPVVMPSFCLVSGHLSNAELTPKRVLGLCQLAVTFLIFQALYHANTLLAYRLNKFDYDALPLHIFSPPLQVVSWFLAALVLWRLLLPVVARLRFPLFFSLCVGVGAIFTDLGLNHQNLLSFFPYFVAGFLLPAHAWRLSRETSVRIPLIALLLTVIASVVFFSAHHRASIADVTLDSPSPPPSAVDVAGGEPFRRFFKRVSACYDCFNGAAPSDAPTACASSEAALARLAFYATSAPLICGFFCAVPNAAGVWSLPGVMSVYIYLLHPLLISNPFVMHYAFDALSRLYGREVNVWSPATASSAVAIVFVGAFVVVAVLSLPLWRCLCSRLVEPDLSICCDGGFGDAPPRTARHDGRAAAAEHGGQKPLT